MANEKLIYANALKAQILWQAEKHNTDYLSVDMVVDAIDNAPTVDAVEVSKLGKLGRLMMPPKGCPRGQMGEMGCAGGSECHEEQLHITTLDIIEDEDGNVWIPVLSRGLKRLKAKLNNTVEVVHGRWVSLTDCANAGVYCSVCNKKVYKEDYAWCNRKNKLRSNYCPNCGAKMDGDGNGNP